MIQAGVESDEAGEERTRADIERQIDDFFVFEVDRNPVACAALHVCPDENKGGTGVRVRVIALRESGHWRPAC